MTNPPIRDHHQDLPILDKTQVFEGMVWNLSAETVDLGQGRQVRREFIDHTGAVAVLALDDDNQVLLLRQYRHPVRSNLWELPAGLLDVTGETWVEAAQRELYEEADLTAATWHTLVDFYTSPGFSNETMRVFLARDLTPVEESQRYQRQAEEADMIPRWVPLTQALDLVLSGRLHNPAAVVGIMAAALLSKDKWQSLRSPHAAFNPQPGS